MATKPKPTKRRLPKPDSKTAKLLTLATITNASASQIAKAVGCNRITVYDAFTRYGITPNALESYKKQRADIFAGLQDRIISSLTEEDIKESSLLQRTTAAGILYDKERIERGLTTDNVGYLDLNRAFDQVRQERVKLGKELGVDAELSTGSDNVDWDVQASDMVEDKNDKGK